MFRRIRQLPISLAAKCQILFGAAVAMIIAAALFVPWHRMEELTDQLNERAASTLADEARKDHMAAEISHLSDVNLPTMAPVAKIAITTTQPLAELLDYHPTRLVGSKPDAPTLTHFERRAINVFLQDPSQDVFAQIYRQADGQSRYRYAARLQATQSCMNCHAAGGFLGVASVDILSQVDEDELRLNRLFILLAGVLAGSLAIAVLYFITTRLILQPVRVLQETAEKVSSGDLNIRSDISTGDEFQQLSETFNTMLVNLKKSTDQLKLLNRNLDLRLGQLAESNVALYESNRLKSEFLANVSHELRTPLNSILGFADLLKETLASGADSKPARYLQNILTSARNLLDLINDLLDLAKIEAGKMEVRSEQLSLGDLFESLVGVLKPLSEVKGLSLVTTLAPDVPIIQTDTAKLQQVLYNFLSNAIKFSPPGAKVELTAQLEDENSIRIAVTDHGPGIEPDKQELIFEKFRQIDGGVTREHGGTGLGLSIAKELTQLLGGTIGVRSAIGKGTTFWIVVPNKSLPGTKDVRQKMMLS
jgi:two-component system, NarL family, sensor histidine kinase BarA